MWGNAERGPRSPSGPLKVYEVPLYLAELETWRALPPPPSCSCLQNWLVISQAGLTCQHCMMLLEYIKSCFIPGGGGASRASCLQAPSGAVFLFLLQCLAGEGCPQSGKGGGESPGNLEPASLNLGQAAPGGCLPIRQTPWPGACKSEVRG